VTRSIPTSCNDPVEDARILRVDEARRRILEHVEPITVNERLALRDCLGRYLGADVISPHDVPGHTNSAMDGYAVAGGDLPATGSREFVVAGHAHAGSPFAGHCPGGGCVRIMTGAVIPAGTDTVVMQEQVEVLDDGRVRIGPGQRPGQNVRQAGEDIHRGATVLAASHRLLPADLGILASLGLGELWVRRRPRVAFFSTGDELRPVGETLAAGEVYDSNRYSIHGMLKRLGVELIDLGVVADDPAALRRALEQAAGSADVVITSGGVSVGEADHIKSVLDEIGDIRFWKIAMKPGRPLTFGRIGAALFFGLPGNPVAVMVTFYQFVQAALEYLASSRVQPPLVLNARAGEALHKRPGRYEFLRGILTTDASGLPVVQRSGMQGSGILTSMSRANCFILLPEESAGVEQGGMVAVQPFAGLV